MGFVGGDITRLHAAAVRLKPEVSAADGQAATARAAGVQAALAAGRADVAGAVESATQALAKAITDTAIAVSALGGAADAQGSGLQAVTDS
jgi:hypothetical protein